MHLHRATVLSSWLEWSFSSGFVKEDVPKGASCETLGQITHTLLLSSGLEKALGAVAGSVLSDFPPSFPGWGCVNGEQATSASWQHPQWPYRSPIAILPYDFEQALCLSVPQVPFYTVG